MNATYLLKLAAKNEIGSSDFHQYHTAIRTLDFDPSFVPRVSVRGLTWNSISISWNTPKDSRKNELINFYKLTRITSDTEVTMYQPADKYSNYLWLHLTPATEYSFTVAACNGFTRECFPPSEVVSATTEDGLSGPPSEIELQCRHDNISGMNFIDVRWKEPLSKSGQIEFYNIKLSGNAKYFDANGQPATDLWGPELKN